MFQRRISAKPTSASTTGTGPRISPTPSNPPSTNGGITLDHVVDVLPMIAGPLHPSRRYSNGSLDKELNNDSCYIPNGQSHDLHWSPSSSSLLSLSMKQSGDGKIHGKRRSSLLVLRLRHHTMTQLAFLLFLSGTCLLLVLWMRTLPSTVPHTTLTPANQLTMTVSTHSTFQIESVNAPVCQSLSSSEEVTFTLVTQLSYDRLWMMEHHCQRYPHPMAIAVYTNQTLEEILEELRDMGCPVDSNSHEKSLIEKNKIRKEEQLDKGDNNLEENDDKIASVQPKETYHQHSHHKGPILQVAVLDANTYGAWNDYPVNDLRNLALSLVQSSHLLYIDVDFWTSNSLYETLSSKTVKQRLIQDPRHAVVVPAFALFRQCRKYKDCRSNNIAKMPRSLPDLADMIRTKRGHIFDPTNKGGHGSTDYNAWFRQEGGSLRNIKCLQSNRYEPFVAIRYCRDMPPFQQAFSGYGKNKVTWMMQVIASGYTLSQVGGGFLVHYPHLDSTSRTHWNESPEELQGPNRNQRFSQDSFNIRQPTPQDGDLHFEDYKRGQVDKIFWEFKEWLAQAIPSSQARLRLCELAQDDDSKLWVDTNVKEERKKQRERLDSEVGQ
jgi:hypothetical protein